MKAPRYYRRVAVNRAVGAVLSGDKRLLLTLATGCGKTFVALQIIAKLWSSGWRADRNPRVLYLEAHPRGRGHLSDFADLHKVTPVVVTTSEMLSTGVDLPPVRNIVTTPRCG